VRNGSSAKTVRTDVGEVRIGVPRDRAGTFTPTVVPKHSRRLTGFDDAVLSLYAKGMTTGDIANHLADIYGSSCKSIAFIRARPSNEVNHRNATPPW
jgi:putative transposase